MLQLVQLQKLYDEFEERDTVVIAIANEEPDLESNARLANRFRRGPPRFVNLVDLEFSLEPHVERTTAYWLDTSGTVRQVFPMEIYSRPPWWAILNEIDAQRSSKKR